MANKKVPTQGGAARGHSNMEHGLHTAEIKDSARKARRREDVALAVEQIDDEREGANNRNWPPLAVR